MNKLCKQLTALAGIIAICFSAYFFIDNRYALAQKVNQIEQRLDYKILSDRLDAVYERIWKFDDRYAGNEDKMPVYDRDEYRRLNSERQKIMEKMKALDNVQ
jgi:hypothetical protein